MKTLGIDIGSSFIKVSVYDANTGLCVSRASSPDAEMPILSNKNHWAEQAPEMWWDHTCQAIRQALRPDHGKDIAAIGITYQMHGLVCLDRQGNSLRPSIIWCDSRAVETGAILEAQLGEDYCRTHLLNSPGNFTAAKLLWVKDNERDLFDRIYHIMLPGDYIAYRLSGEMNTSLSGLSEGIFWDFHQHRVSEELLRVSGLAPGLLCPLVPAFGEQGRVLPQIAAELGLKPGIPITYRAGDQPNNAYSLHVMQPGEVAATAGTSGVVYGITDRMVADPSYRVNPFAHVNHTEHSPRLGVLLCINGTGILNSWMRKTIANGIPYVQMNAEAEEIQPGCEGLCILPFGNGSERMLENRDVGSRIIGLHFNRHTRAHLFRAAQEGIAFAFRYGMEAMKEVGITPKVIRAAHTNMFLSPVFRQILADATGVNIDLYDTDGSQGAAMGAATGVGFYADHEEAGQKIKKILTVEPSADPSGTTEAFTHWKSCLDTLLTDQ